MEAIISKLLVDDSIEVQRATAELHEAFKQPGAVMALCEVVVSSEKPAIRQYGAVLLRKRLGKFRNWQLVDPAQQELIKEGMFKAILSETEKTVRNSVAQLVGVLVKHESSKQNPWMSDVLQFIFERCSSGDAQQSELGSSIFATLTDTAPDQFLPHIGPVCEMFSAAMVATEANGNVVTPVVLNIMLGMGHLVPFILGHNGAEQTYQKAVPYVVQALQSFAEHRADDFSSAFDILDTMSEYTPKLLSPHTQLLIEFCLNSASNVQFDHKVRVRVVTFLGQLIKLKKTMIVKQKLVEPIIQVIFSLMTIPSDEDEEDSDGEDDFYVDEDKANPRTAATQTLDLLALHIPPEKLIPPLLQLVEPALRSNDPYQQKAAYLSLGVIAEGCGDTISSKYLRPMLDCVKAGILHENPTVRNAGLFSFGQFAEFLQPEISQYADEIMPILSQFLHHLCIEIRAGNEVKNADRMFYAIETFCENLDEGALVPHLPLLMEQLFETLNPANNVRLRILAMSSLSAIVQAVKMNILPYFPKIIDGLQMYLTATDNADIEEIRPQAISTLAGLARNVGKEHFMPLTNNAMTFGLGLLESATDPELRSSLYDLFAALAEVVNAEMAPVLPKIIEKMLIAVNSCDDVLPEFRTDEIILDKNEDNSVDVIDIENSDGEDDDDGDLAGLDVVNAFLDEKEEAVLSLKKLAEFTGPAFVPYISTCFENVYKLLDHPNEGVRNFSLDALTQFVLSLNQNKDDAGVQNAILILIPKTSELVRTDEEVEVVMAGLQSFTTLLKELKEKVVFTEELKLAIFKCINLVLNKNVTCQTFDEPLEDEDCEESEFDASLSEAAGDVLPKFGGALSPAEFALYFGRILPTLLNKIAKLTDNDDQETQRSYMYGTLSECFEPLQNHTGTWFETLLPIYLRGLQDKCEQVRHNTVFGIGELFLYSEDKAYDKFPMILQSLSAAVARETHPGTLDNICGALARLILANFKLIPLEQVLPVFVQHLPLREDFDENLAVFKSFLVLWTQQNEALLLVLDRIILAGLHVLHKNEYKDDETRDIILNLLKDIRLRCSDKFDAVANSDPAVAAFVQTL